ncbi:MAG TPA: PaaX family transcriptional regulator C-terminal domain-containing protein [Acidimicrobiales bacterium]|nr:PaaX family transcriptional regulator C-terminal domain-containing protein [Acidimicrobiales bacterium]
MVGVAVDAGVGGSPLQDESAPRLLVWMFLGYWFENIEFVPSAALVALLGSLGVGEAAARAALSRLARRGSLEGTKLGRNTAYRLAAGSAQAARAQGRRVLKFGSGPSPWDRQWTCVVFSIPESDRRRRPALRQRLRELRLGPLFDGFWITPRAPLAAIDRSLTELGVSDAAVFRVCEVPRPAGVDLLSAWDLRSLRADYEDLIESLEPVVRRVRQGTLPDRDALVARSAACARWRYLAAADPGLPDELLPRDWPQRQARELFVEAYDSLGPAAERRVRELVGSVRGVSSPAPHHRRIEDCLGVARSA